MGREIRRVPPDWQHPKDAKGNYLPMYDCTHAEAMADWNDLANDDPTPPDPAYYRPAWPEESATAYQIYQTVSEGSPVSPVFTTREALIDYLVNDGGGMGCGGTVLRLSREAAEQFAAEAWAPSMIGGPAGLVEGVLMYEPARAEGKEPTP